MEELVKRLYQIPDSYFGFIAGVIAYVRRKPERVETVMHFLDTAASPSSSDVLWFISNQPDFHEFGLTSKHRKEQEV